MRGSAASFFTVMICRSLHRCLGSAAWRRPTLLATVGTGVIIGAAPSAARCEVSSEVGLALGFGIGGFLLGSQLKQNSFTAGARGHDQDRQGYEDALKLLEGHFAGKGAANKPSVPNQNVFASNGINHVVLLTWKPGTPELLLVDVRRKLVRRAAATSFWEDYPFVLYGYFAAQSC